MTIKFDWVHDNQADLEKLFEQERQKTLRQVGEWLQARIIMCEEENCRVLVKTGEFESFKRGEEPWKEGK